MTLVIPLHLRILSVSCDVGVYPTSLVDSEVGFCATREFLMQIPPLYMRTRPR